MASRDKSYNSLSITSSFSSSSIFKSSRALASAASSASSSSNSSASSALGSFSGTFSGISYSLMLERSVALDISGWDYEISSEILEFWVVGS